MRSTNKGVQRRCRFRLSTSTTTSQARELGTSEGNPFAGRGLALSGEFEDRRGRDSDVGWAVELQVRGEKAREVKN